MLGHVNDLDLRLIKVFIAVIEAGGITPAQSTLNVGQSTISMQLASLEVRLGFRLCERGRKGFALTAKGAAFAEIARGLVASLQDFDLAARNLDKKLVGNLRIGMIGHIPGDQSIRLSKAIGRFRRRDEAVKISIWLGSPRRIEERLLNNQLDVAISYFWHRAPTLQYTPLFIERQRAYCGKDHPLFKQAGRVTAADVADCDWAWRSYPIPETGMTSAPRRIGAMADNMEALAILILSGHHLGFLPEHFAAPYLQQKHLAALNPAALGYDVTFHVVTRLRRHLGDIALAFLDDLKMTYLAGTQS